MANTLVGTPQGGIATNGGDVTLTFDVAPAENDVVVVLGGYSCTGSAPTNSPGPKTAGYTTMHQFSNTNLGLSASYKVMGATPDTSVTCAGFAGGNSQRAAAAYSSYVLRGVDTANVEDAIATTVGPISDGTEPDNPSITTVTDSAWVIIAACTARHTSKVLAAPTGYINDILLEGDDTERYHFGSATREIATPGAEDPGAWSWQDLALGQEWYAITVAIVGFDPDRSVVALTDSERDTVQGIVDRVESWAHDTFGQDKAKILRLAPVRDEQGAVQRLNFNLRIEYKVADGEDIQQLIIRKVW